MKNIESEPSLDQLRKLASIGANSTKENASGRWNERTGEYYAVDRLDSIVMREEDDNLDSVRHSMGVRIGKRAVGNAFAIWRLEYFDTYRVEHQAAEQIRAVTKYEFEWSAKQVLLARRSLMLKTSQDTVQNSDLGDDILRFHVPDDAAALLEAQMDFEQMTHDDCDRLIDDTAAYYAQLATVNRQAVK